MFRKINLQKKIFLFYSVSVAAIFILLSTFFYSYIFNYKKNDSQSYFIQVVSKVSTNIDNLILDLDTVSTQLIASKDLQTIFQEGSNSTLEGKNYFDLSLADQRAAQSIFLSINSPKDRARIITVANSPTNYVSIGDDNHIHISGENYEKWINYFNQSKDFFKVLPPRNDGISNAVFSPTTFSLIRPLIATYSSCKNIGLIELQQDYSKIENICRLDDDKSGLKLFIIDDEGNIIYPFQRNSNDETEMYFKCIKGAEPGKIFSIINQLSGHKEFICYSNISNYSWHVILVQPESLFMMPVYQAEGLLLLLCFLFIAVTTVIIFIVSTSLTRPIRDLRESIKSISFENPSISIHTQHDEIMILKDTFNEMLCQLKNSANKIIQSRSSELHAHFLALQAQINPHFLYNSLMSISAAGQEAGSQKVQIMCSQLGDIFRYIASTDDSSITIHDEINHAKTYLKFIKWRYEERLEFSIDIQPNMYDIRVPKLILQPIIENCFSHGFLKIKPPIIINITGSITEDTWIIEVEDNGMGFSEDALNLLTQQIEKIDRNISNGVYKNDFKVGGMALLNIYTRLKLLYSEKTIFHIINLASRGSKVTIGGTVIKSTNDDIVNEVKR